MQLLRKCGFAAPAEDLRVYNPATESRHNSTHQPLPAFPDCISGPRSTVGQ